MMKLVLKCTDTRFSILVLLKPLEKLLSMIISNPLLKFSSYIKSLSTVFSKYLLILLTAVLWYAFKFLENLAS